MTDIKEAQGLEEVGFVVLGGLFHGGSGPELGDIDIEPDMGALERIQYELVDSSDDVIVPLCSLPKAQAVIDQLTVERDAARESMYALDELTDKQSDLINAQIKRVVELERLTEAISNDCNTVANERNDLRAELAATKEHLHTVEPEFHSLQATRNMAEKTVEIMIRRAESAEAELAELKSAPVVMPDRRIQALAGVSLFDLGHAKGWNACLDKFESLNRSKP